jgi:hypothetical protein
MVLISQLKLAEATLNRMLSMDYRTFLEHSEEDLQVLQLLELEVPEEELKEVAIPEEAVPKEVAMVVTEVVTKTRTGIITTKAHKYNNNQTYLVYW